MYNDPFYGVHGSSAQTVMGADGLSVVFNLPRARKSEFRGGEEVAQSLPEYAQRCAYLVDDYPAAPEAWLRSKPGVLSYMLPVKAEHGMWLDFNGCSRHNHHVAVRISVQGVCALTYRKTDAARLEQYRESCPDHGIPFTGTRRCSSCGFEWPPQNYLATTGTPHGYFWLDGFRMPDGTTRQYVFTEDEARSVAKAVLGAERVHAIGVQFFLSREPKPVVERPVFRAAALELDDGPMLESLSFGDTTRGLERTRGTLSAKSVMPRKSFEVAAGAKIRQLVYPDPQDISFWQPEPALSIVINYTDEVTMSQVLAGGRSAVSEGPLGSLGIPVGH